MKITALKIIIVIAMHFLFFFEAYPEEIGDEHEPKIISIVKNGSIQELKDNLRSKIDIDVKHHGIPTIFFTLVDKCEDKKLKVLLDAGALVNIREDIGGAYPVHYASQHSNMKCLKLLINNNANLRVVDFQGENPYFYAVDFNNMEAINILYENGLNFTEKNHYGIDAVHYSVSANKPSLFVDVINDYVKIKLKGVAEDSIDH